MSARPKLHAVAPDEKPATQPKAKAHANVADAARTGSRREVLASMRNRLAKTLDSDATPPHAIARLARELADIDREIRSMDDADEGSDDNRSATTAQDDTFDASAI